MENISGGVEFYSCQVHTVFGGKEIELRDLNLGLPNNILHCKNWLSQTHFFTNIIWSKLTTKKLVEITKFFGCFN